MGNRRSASAIRPVVARRADLWANASAATAAVLFGASVVAVRAAVRDVPPISLAVLRIGQGGLLLAAILTGGRAGPAAGAVGAAASVRAAWAGTVRAVPAHVQ